MRSERPYIVKFRPAGRGHRDDKIGKAFINAMTCADANEQAKKHPQLKGMKILNVFVDPKHWKQLKRQAKVK